MTDTAAFWDKAAPKYSKSRISDMAAYEYTLERTKSYLSPEDRVLEMGCGTGSTALLLAPHVREFVATDVSPAMIDIARAKAKSDGVDNIDFRTASAEASAKLNEPFDVVLGHNLFHLVRNAEDIFDDVHRMLPRGGYFITKTGCIGDRSLGWKRFAFRLAIPVMQLIGKAPYLRYFTHKDLEAAITFAGFEIVESGNFPAMSRYIVARRM